jgi:ABC-type branched-subunit amino acid transport system ATPase component
VQVLGEAPDQMLARVGFVAQDRPLYRSFCVRDMLTLGQKLNPNWDMDLARERLARISIPLDRPTGKLSGGQQAQVALVMALAKRPEILILDEPIASLHVNHLLSLILHRTKVVFVSHLIALRGNVVADIATRYLRVIQSGSSVLRWSSTPPLPQDAPASPEPHDGSSSPDRHPAQHR